MTIEYSIAPLSSRVSPRLIRQAQRLNPGATAAASSHPDLYLSRSVTVSRGRERTVGGRTSGCGWVSLGTRDRGTSSSTGVP